MSGRKLLLPSASLRGFVPTSFNSLATAGDGVLRSAVDGCAATIMRHRYLGRCRRDIASCVSHLESDGIDATIAVTGTFSAQLHRLAITGDDDIVGRIAVS